jgi:cell division septum initiation protein DivIVA
MSFSEDQQVLDATTGVSAASRPFLPAERVDENIVLPSGFQLRRLLLRGANVSTAELRFTSGLNVVSGPSNTGKSFALYCIDFMLGAKQLGKRVQEAEAYDEGVLEVESADGETFTLRRALTGGQFRWYNVPFEEIGLETPFRSLQERHTGGRADSVSAQLLALSGLANKILLKSKSKKTTQALSFRNLAKLLVVEEQQIIHPGSPVTGANPIQATAEISLFELLLTGIDASGIVSSTDRSESRRRLQAQADLLDELLDALNPSSDVETEDKQDLGVRRSTLDARVEELTASLETSSRSIDDALRESESEQNWILEAKSRLITVDELLSRFRLLDQSYAMDLSRLSLIETGSDLLAQLPAVICPTCGRPMDGAHTDHAAEDELPTGEVLSWEVREACAAEATKIMAHRADLNSTVEQLLQERSALAEQVHAGNRRIAELGARVQLELKPRVQELTRSLREVISARQEVLRLENVQQQRDILLQRRYNIDRELRALRAGSTETADPHEIATGEFVASVRRVLRSWQFPRLTSVAFDRKAMDLVISGRPRRDQGKGIRAILYSAFVVALMRMCEEEGRPHPGFVILDSPLTTYKGPAQLGEHDLEIPASVEAAFFRDLAEPGGEGRTREQTIIFENKVPPAEVRELINYIEFTGRDDFGRMGFIPVTESEDVDHDELAIP